MSDAVPRPLSRWLAIGRYALLGGFVLMEPPLGAGGAVDAAKPVTQWTRVSAHDSQTACDTARTARIADAEDDLGEDAEADQGGSKLGGAFRARMAARCVADAELVAPAAGAK